MKPLNKTLQLSQVQGEPLPNPQTGKWRLTHSKLPCSCTVCRTYTLSHSECLYKDVRDIQTVDIKTLSDNTASTESDPFGLRILNKSQLKEHLIGRGVYVPSRLNKPELMLLLTDVLESENEEEEHQVVGNNG